MLPRVYIAACVKPPFSLLHPVDVTKIQVLECGFARGGERRKVVSVKCGFDFILFFTLPTPCNLQLENVVTLKPPQTFLRQNANSSFFYEYAKSIEMDEPHLIFRKGASIKYVRRFSGILDPLPPLVRFSRNLSVLSFEYFPAF